MLCETCVDVLEHRRGVTSNRGGWMNFTHHKTLQSFLKSIREKCQVCWGLWRKYAPGETAPWNRAFLAEIQGEAKTDYTYTVGSLNCYRRFGKELILTLSIWPSDMYLPRDIMPMEMASFILGPEDEDKSPELPSKEFTSTRTSSDESFAQAKKWIEACLKMHKTCNTNTNTTTSWFPTRLLHIPSSTDLTSPSTTVKIIHIANNPPSGPYLTLSHRWGLVHLIQLLSNNIHEFTTTGIPISSLPLTFRDALSAAQNLGVEYIWIDSLCIIQDRDDLTDWIKEANLMHKVYANGICNLSASDANDSTQGLFREREPATLQGRVRLCMDGLLKGEEDAEGGGEGGSGWFINTTLAESELWARNVPWSAINRRGWVFQERLLSPRILYFGKSQLFWECCEVEACESHPEGLPEAINKLGPGAGLKVLDLVKRLERVKDDAALDVRDQKGLEDAVSDMWSGMVETYTRCDLTVAGDKLIALSGIAQQMEGVFGDEYVAGMWRSRLALDLQWRVRPVGKGVRPQGYRAPSWCWASVDGVIHMGGRRKTMMEVVDVHLEFAVEGVRTGNLKEGCYVDIKGQLRKVDVKEVVGTGWETVDGLTMNPVELDVEDHENILPPKPQPVKKSKKKEGVREKEQSGQTEEVALLKPRHIFAMVPRELDPSNDKSVLLLELIDPQKVLFKRMGMAYARYEGGNAAFWKIPDDPASIPGLLDSVTGEHTVRVI